MTQVIRVFIADDHQIVREGLRMLLGENAGFIIVGEAATGHEVVDRLGDANPDVVVMDISMPDLNGLEATRRILQIKPDTRVIGLSMHDDKQFVLGMLRAGAAGYLLKDCATAELVGAVRAVHAGKTYLTREISGIVVAELKKQLAESADTEQEVLSDREKEVLQLIAEGRSTREIAEKLVVSIKTVESHRKNIMDKLGLHTIPALTKYAVRKGLTSL